MKIFDVRTSTRHALVLTLQWLFIAWLPFSAALAQNQPITGTVFRDFNGNGTRDLSTEIMEIGVPGVVVTAYNSNGTDLPVATTTSATGAYTLATGAGSYRVEFTAFPTGFYETMVGTDNGTAVRLVTSGSTLNLGLNRPSEYCQPNPSVAIPCYPNGLGSPTEQIIVTIPYSAAGNNVALKTMLNSPSPASSASVTVGSVWGTGYRRTTGDLFTASFMKRHSAFGSGGPGAIYRTNRADDPRASSSSLFVTLNAGTDPHNTTDFTKDEIRTVGATTLNPFDAVGKIGLGDLDIDADGRYLYVINLFDRKLYQITIDADQNPATAPSEGDIRSYEFPATGCPGGVARPFGLGINPVTGNVFASITCDGSDNTDPTNATALRASIYEFNVISASFNPTPATTFSLNYERGVINGGQQVFGTKGWHTWLNTWTKGVTPNLAEIDNDYGYYPQPLLSDLVFDTDGSLVIGITDRFSHQTTPLGYDATGVNSFSGVKIAAGDLLRACNTGTLANPTYIVDVYNGGLCGSDGNGTSGKNNNPNTLRLPEFYSSEYIDPYHYETTLGGLALLYGSGQVLTSIMNPVNTINANGFAVFSNTTGNALRDFVVVQPDDLFSKGASVGDLEVLCQAAPTQIGNLVWNDLNNNGVQDGGEPGLAGVVVRLKGPGLPNEGVSVTTNSAGNYYFSSASGANTTGFAYNLTDLIPGGRYELVFPASLNENMLGLSTKPDSGPGPNADAIDTDANTAGVIGVTLGGIGQNNFTYDVAYILLPPPPVLVLSKQVSTTIAQLGQVVSYTVTLANTGRGAATNVIINEKFTEGISLIANSINASTGSFTPGIQSGIWAISSVEPGATATLIFSANITAEGILYNNASIPGQQVEVCTSVPFRVCQGSNYGIVLSAPAGFSRYQWLYMAPGSTTATAVADGGLTSYTATKAGTYKVLTDDGLTGLCARPSCCPVFIQEIALVGCVPIAIRRTKRATQ